MRGINNVIGIVNLVDNTRSLGVITENRPLATVPFGGRYRLIDFILSGMTNSGITNIGILTPWQHRSLYNHLRGRESMDTIILLPSFFGFAGSDVDHLSSNVDFLRKSQQEYVIVAGANAVSNMDFRKLLRFHQQMSADVTMLYKQEDASEQDCANCVLIDIEPDQRVSGIRSHPAVIDGKNFFLGTFILEKSLLLKILEECRAEKGSGSILQGISNNLGRLKVYAYHYDGYAARIHCLESFYRHNMALLNPATWCELFKQPRTIFTKIKDDAPTKYIGQAKVSNALIAGGCLIEGTVENSLLFRNVKIGKEAYIRDSILMPNTEIAEKACLEYVICDKNVLVNNGQCLRGRKERPIILKKGTVL